MVLEPNLTRGGRHEHGVGIELGPIVGRGVGVADTADSGRIRVRHPVDCSDGDIFVRVNYPDGVRNGIAPGVLDVPIPIGDSIYVKLYGVKDSLTLAPLADGSCTYSIKDSLGIDIPGGSGTLSYQGTDSSGANYLGSVTGTITSTLTPRLGYSIIYLFVQGSYRFTVALSENAVYPVA